MESLTYPEYINLPGDLLLPAPWKYTAAQTYMFYCPADLNTQQALLDDWFGGPDEKALELKARIPLVLFMFSAYPAVSSLEAPDFAKGTFYFNAFSVMLMAQRGGQPPFDRSSWYCFTPFHFVDLSYAVMTTWEHQGLYNGFAQEIRIEDCWAGEGNETTGSFALKVKALRESDGGERGGLCELANIQQLRGEMAPEKFAEDNGEAAERLIQLVNEQGGGLTISEGQAQMLTGFNAFPFLTFKEYRDFMYPEMALTRNIHAYGMDEFKLLGHTIYKDKLQLQFPDNSPVYPIAKKVFGNTAPVNPVMMQRMDWEGTLRNKGTLWNARFSQGS